MTENEGIERADFNIKKRQTKKSVKYAINCYDNDLGWWFPHRTVDWLVDGTILTRENTILIAEHPLHPYYQLSGMARGRGIEKVSEIRPRWMLPWIWWHLLKRKYPDLKHVIFCNTFGRQTYYRNLTLHYMGIQTWLYFHSANTLDMWFPPNNIPKITLLQHLNYHHILCWHEQQKRLVRYHTEPCGIKTLYHIVGAPFADWAQQRRNEETVDKNLVAFFDTSFGNGLTSSEMYARFLNDVILYKKQHPEKRVCLKLKKPLFPAQASACDVPFHLWPDREMIRDYTVPWQDTENQDIKRAFVEMKASDITIEYPESHVNYFLTGASEIIAMPYTSVVIEALAAGCPARWWGVEREMDQYIPFRDGMVGDRIRQLLNSS